MFHLRLVTFFLFFLAICNIAKSDSVTVSEDKTQSTDTSVQQNIDTDEVTLTVSGNAQVDDDAKAVLVDAGVDGASVIVESGSTITTTSGDNGIQVGRMSKHMHGQASCNPPSGFPVPQTIRVRPAFFPQKRFDCTRIKTKGVGRSVHEYRLGTTIANCVDRRDEAQRRANDQVVRSNAEANQGDVQRRRAIDNGNGKLGFTDFRRIGFKTVDIGADGGYPACV